METADGRIHRLIALEGTKEFVSDNALGK